MTFIDRLWLRLPIVVRAVLLGLAAAAVGTMPWAALVATNIRHQSTVPWAVPGNVAVLLIVAGLTVLAFSTLARATCNARASSAAQRENII